MRITEADRKLMAPAHIDLGPDCPMCPAHEAREHQLRTEIENLKERCYILIRACDAERLTVEDQSETIDRIKAEVYRQKTHFWMLALVPALGLAYALYQVRP